MGVEEGWLKYSFSSSKKTVLHITGRSCFHNEELEQICEASGKVMSCKRTVPSGVIFPIYILPSPKKVIILELFLYPIEIKGVSLVSYC